MSGELGLVVEDVADSMEEFKQSVEWFRRLYIRATKIRGPEKLTHWEAQSPQKNKL